MDSEKTAPVETPAAESPAATNTEPRRTSRRQEIRAALLAVPAVVALSSSVFADTTPSSASSGAYKSA